MRELTLRTQMSCAHFYHQKEWSAEKNQKTFGKCFTDYGHGHDYVLEVVFEISSETDPEAELRNKVDQVREKLDHQHLNFTIPQFKDQIPTTENLALFILKELSNLKPSQKIRKLRLFETPSIFVEVE